MPSGFMDRLENLTVWEKEMVLVKVAGRAPRRQRDGLLRVRQDAQCAPWA